MTVDITLRPLAAADEAEWRRLWTAYLAFYGTSREEAVFAATFARLLPGGDPAMQAIVADRGEGRLAGLVHLIYHRHCWRLEDVCYLQDLYADADLRGQGVGRRLIEAAYAAADAAGAPAVYWLTQDSNAPARALYDRVADLTPFIKYQRPPA